RRALVPRDRDAAAPESAEALRGDPLPRARGEALARPAARPPGGRGRPGAGGARHVPLPLRPPRARPRPRARALELLLPARDVRPRREAGVRLLRPADPARRPSRRPDRARRRPEDAHARRQGRLLGEGPEAARPGRAARELGPLRRGGYGRHVSEEPFEV